jgi:lipopolysaccharide transport system ATP-binding protein
VYLNGSILGMSRREIARKFDEIVAFAEVEQFLDTPVKRYSSGMYVRLAFAVMAHLEPEILIVDEVLAVGDAEFQRRCLGKMNDVVRSGRTVIFVSHNLAMMARLMNHGVLLAHGRLLNSGPIGPIVKQYLSLGGSASTSEWHREPESACKPTRITTIRSLDAHGQLTAVIDADSGFAIEITFTAEATMRAQLAFRLNSDVDNETIFTSAFSDATLESASVFQAGTYVASCPIPRHLLPPGRYHVLVALNNPSGPQYDLIERALSFEVSEVGSMKRIDGRLGAIMPQYTWSLQSATGVSF